jgi:DNA protecting protein DprA
MNETKHLLATLSWRGVRLSPKLFTQMCKVLPAQTTDKEILHGLEEVHRQKLSFEPKWYDRSRKEIDWVFYSGAKFVTLVDPDYPAGLKEFRDAPPALTVHGDCAWARRQGLSIVGSRNPSPSSLIWLDQELDELLAREDIYIASGGARGIDQKAHGVAIRTQRPTVCLVPAGLGSIYPKNLESWLRPVLEHGGAFVSSYAPSQCMEKNLFIERNRYIAALTSATLIVEAKRKSGTMVTARWARALERPVGVVPCSPTAAGLGGLDVLADEGILIRDHKDLIIMLDRAEVKTLPLFAKSVGLL